MTILSRTIFWLAVLLLAAGLLLLFQDVLLPLSLIHI